MDTHRKYGVAPYTVVVVHGGPGALGELTTVASRIGEYEGCLETLHAACTVEGQVEELREAIEKHTHAPVSLIGHSWGAWLVFIFAARYTSLVRKVILIGSGPFEASYASEIMKTRMSRLTDSERDEVQSLIFRLTDKLNVDDSTLARFGRLLAKADIYDPLEINEKVTVRSDVYEGVWPEASALRESGELLRMGSSIECPVVAIHGDYDPHPAEGVRRPLSQVIKEFEFILLKNCGHKPWIERAAQARFYDILRDHLT